MSKENHHAPWWVVLFDALLIVVSFGVAYWVRYDLEWFVDVSNRHPITTYLPLLASLVALLLITFQLDGVYNRWQRRSWTNEMYTVINATAKVAVVLMALTYFFRLPLSYSRLLFIEAAFIVVALLGVARLILRTVRQRLLRQGIGTSRVIIVGAGEVGRTVMRNIVARPELGYTIVGLVDDNPDKGLADLGRIKGLGMIENLGRAIEQYMADEVIITLPWMYHRKILGIVRECERKQVRARIVPDMFQMSLSQVDVDDLGGLPLIGVRNATISSTALFAKRAMDTSLAALGMFVAAPLMLLIALAIRLDSSGPAIFRQVRVGKGGRHFQIYKFRSMRMGAEAEMEALRALNEADGPLFKIRQDPRLTRVGRFLRRTSLDELPQLFNVLLGEMSLVGPRPPLPCEVAQYQEWHKQRLEVPPGLTGLWQVSGRSELAFDEMVLLDVYYIENWSPWLDLQILLRTVPSVLGRQGAY